jgi:hypothetical protein
MPVVGGRNPQSLSRIDRFEIGVKQQNMQKKSLKISFYKTCKTSKKIETFDVSTLPKYLVVKLSNVKLLLLHCQLANMIFNFASYLNAIQIAQNKTSSKVTQCPIFNPFLPKHFFGFDFCKGWDLRGKVR